MKKLKIADSRFNHAGMTKSKTLIPAGITQKWQDIEIIYLLINCPIREIRAENDVDEKPGFPKETG